MDSFKKGSSKINIPIAIRFNAHEDSVEDVVAEDAPLHPASSSLPTSSSTSIGSEPPLSSSVGTWKIFKGRVSQAMGDMKSKHSDSSITSKKSKLTEESDSELKDDEKKKEKDASKQSVLTSTFEKCKKSKKSENEKEINGKDGDKKVSSTSKTKIEPVNTNDSENILRRRHTDSQPAASEQSDLDIESGVEITEEMTLSFYGTIPSNSNTSSVLSNEQKKSNSSIIATSRMARNLQPQLNKLKSLHEGFIHAIKRYKCSISFAAILLLQWLSDNTSDFLEGFLFALFLLCLFFETVGVIRKKLAPIPRKDGYYCVGADKDDVSSSAGLPCNHKVRDIQRSLSTESKVLSIHSDENDIFEHKLVLSYTGWMNEIAKYDPTNYHSSMTRTVAIRLDGSMLRISSCSKDTPNKERVPRRAMWNEPFYNQQSVLDHENVSSNKKKVKNKHWRHINPALYSKHRFFELLNCTVELLPRGLAHKRHFSKKYPIQLTIRQTTSAAAPKLEQDTIIEENKSENADLEADVDAETIDVQDIEKVTEDFLEKERMADDIVPKKIEEVKKTTKFSKSKTIILFARCDREKEDWYRRFLAASLGKVYVTANPNIQNVVSPWGELEANEFPDLVMVNATDLNRPKETSPKTPLQKKSDKKRKRSKERQKKKLKKNSSKSSDEDWKWALSSGSDTDDTSSVSSERDVSELRTRTISKGLIMSACASQGPESYIKFMSVYQHFSKLTTFLIDEQDGPIEDSSVPDSYMTSAFKYYFLSPKKAYYSAEQNELPTAEKVDKVDKVDAISTTSELTTKPGENTREQRDVDILWINVFLGRIIYSFLMNQQFAAWIHSMLQRKLDIIKLPVFMENICINNINLGDTAPIFKNSQPPVCDERGLWFESDLTYRGLVHMTISVQLNLMRLKREEQHKFKVNTDKNESSSDESDSDEFKSREKTNKSNSENKQASATSLTAKKAKGRHKLNTIISICDSDAESVISSNESESDTLSQHYYSASDQSDTETPTKPPADKSSAGGGGKSKKLLRFVDRITASNFFQSATEISFVHKAMKNMSKNIRLCVEVKGVEGRIVFNIPPPPTDRLWITFRTPPKLLISATPAVGETTFDWDIVTSTIESKLYEEILKILVYPNMLDIIIPVLGEPTYQVPEESPRGTPPPSP